MKNQALFSSKDTSTKLKCRLLQFLFGALKVNINTHLPEKNLNGGIANMDITLGGNK